MKILFLYRYVTLYFIYYINVLFKISIVVLIFKTDIFSQQYFKKNIITEKMFALHAIK